MEYFKKIMGEGLVDVDGELADKVDESENELFNKIEITDTE